jgi:hypothetical protein
MKNSLKNIFSNCQKISERRQEVQFDSKGAQSIKVPVVQKIYGLIEHHRALLERGKREREIERESVT